MHTPEPILAADLFAPLDEELVRLLRGLSAEDWKRSAVGSWTVKDVAAHLLDTTLRRLSAQRDHYFAPFAATDGLAAIINQMNASWVSALQRVSPPILVEMLEHYGRMLAQFIASLDPYAQADWSVSWAGEDKSAMWFDIARELTERWHHQQQIRDAVGAKPLYDLRFFKPVMDTFLRGLPFAYRNASAPAGTAITFNVHDVTTATLLRDGSAWSLNAAAGKPVTTVVMAGDTAWRLFTKGLGRDEARRRSTVTGDAALAEPLFGMLTIVG